MKKQVHLQILTLLLLISATLFAESFPTELILNNGDVDTKVNFVFLGDGYQSHEMGKYIQDVTNTVNGMFNQEPFKSSKSNFNVVAVKVPSNVSGAADDPSSLIDNYFGSTFNYSGIQRLLVPTKQSKINSVLAASFPGYDQVIVIVNDSRYGGAGGRVATHSTHPEAVNLALHEVGHSYADLADEYWYREQEKANQTHNGNSTTIRWKQFIGQDGVGIYSHAAPNDDWYRPHQSCKMRYLSGHFCAVCKHALNERTTELLADGGGLKVPSNLKSYDVTSTSFSFYWTTVSGATAYSIQLWNGSVWVDKGSTSKYYFGFSGLTAGSTQYARVKATNSSSSSDWSDYITVTLTSETSAPPVPENLRATTVQSNGFYAIWDAVSSATGYDVQQWVNGAWKNLGNTSNTYKWIWGQAQTTQYFRVRATNDYGSSSYSNYSSVTLPSAAPVQELEPAISQVNDRKINIYPNPSNDYIKIASNAKLRYNVKIYTLSGSVIMDKWVDARKEIDIRHLHSGYYSISIQEENGELFTSKLIKK